MQAAYEVQRVLVAAGAQQAPLPQGQTQSPGTPLLPEILSLFTSPVRCLLARLWKLTVNLRLWLSPRRHPASLFSRVAVSAALGSVVVGGKVMYVSLVRVGRTAADTSRP